MAERTDLQRPAIVFVAAFLLCALGTLALPLISDFPTVLDADGGQIGPFLALAAGVMIVAVSGQQNPVAAGIASGVVTLIAIVFTLVTLIGVVLQDLVNDVTDIPWGGGAYAYGGAAFCGVTASVLSARAWYAVDRSSLGGLALGGVGASAMIAIGMLAPRQGLSFNQWVGFEAHGLLGVATIVTTVSLGVAFAVGFLTGPWGVGLHIGLFGYILVGWLASAPTTSTAVIAWSGVSADFHGLAITGFWAAMGLAALNAAQILSSKAGSANARAGLQAPVAGTSVSSTSWQPPERRASLEVSDPLDAKSTFDPPSDPAPLAATPDADAAIGGVAEVSPSTATMCVAVFSDGREHIVAEPVVIGRDPSVPNSHPDAVVIEVADHTVSKTHAVIGREGERAWVCDLDSRNGITMEGPAERVVQPGDLALIRPADRIILGDDTSFVIEWRELS